ncbi:MAG: hypothetical protein FJ379_10535 [Verrucomicrobia bacterium]|nr:hypothetical protein [Verrucomicrobiota bacterium]
MTLRRDNSPWPRRFRQEFQRQQKVARFGSRNPRACRHGFTRIELATLVALAAVLATLVVAFLSNSRIHGRLTTCSDHLRQVVQAVNHYENQTGRRPRALSRVMRQPLKTDPTNPFLCPADPASRMSGGSNLFWGSLANPSQEPWTGQGDLREPESGSWAAELAEINETEPFSYLHPLSWRRDAWRRLTVLGPETGIAVCQLHGVRVPNPAASADFRPFRQYEGLVLRGTRDGSVVRRRVFRAGYASETPTKPQYPWEFYSDAPPPPLR